MFSFNPLIEWIEFVLFVQNIQLFFSPVCVSSLLFLYITYLYSQYMKIWLYKKDWKWNKTTAKKRAAYHGCVEQLKWSPCWSCIRWCDCRCMLQRIGTSPWWWLWSCRFPCWSSRWCVTKRVIDIIHMRPHI